MTGDDIIRFGKYSGKKVSELPYIYLINFYDQNFNSTNPLHKELIEYIESIRISKNKQNSDIELSESGKMICKISRKIYFLSEKDARIELRRIRSMEQENKKPIRVYECDMCSGWHLTSKPL